MKIPFYYVWELIMVKPFSPDKTVDPEKMKALILSIKIKLKYKKGIFFDYNPNKLSKDLRISYYMVKKYVPIMKKMGIAYERDGHLCVKGYHNQCNNNKGYMSKRVCIDHYIYTWIFSFRDDMDALRRFLLQSNLALQDKIIKLREMPVYSKAKKLIRSGYDLGKPQNPGNKVRISYRTISKRMGCSISLVKRILDWQVSFGWIKSYEQEKSYHKISRMLKKPIKQCLNTRIDTSLMEGYWYRSKNREFLINHKGTSIVLHKGVDRLGFPY